MSETTKPPVLFWIAGVIFLIWNLFACYGFWLEQTMTDEAYTEAYNAASTVVRDKYPFWSMAGYAIGVGGGLLGAIMFLLRKKIALPIFIISLLGAIISFAWPLTNAEAKAAYGPYFWVMPVIVFAMGAIEIWVSKRKIAKGILR